LNGSFDILHLLDHHAIRAESTQCNYRNKLKKSSSQRFRKYFTL